MGENKLLFSTFDRRRILLITLVTCVLLPTLWLISRNTPEQTGSTSVVEVSTSNTGSAADDESLDPIILGGPAPIIQDGSAKSPTRAPPKMGYRQSRLSAVSTMHPTSFVSFRRPRWVFR